MIDLPQWNLWLRLERNQWVVCSSDLSIPIQNVWSSITIFPCPMGSSNDVVQWLDSVACDFSNSRAWNSIRVVGQKHSFIAWRCLLDSFAIADQLRKRGILVLDACVFYWAGLETRDHH
ncbi:hypothetical protein NE237_020494 [Protea cynaroides]|uniref:Reverse transcriptase zinc-binding domain-containing protein n=1 Tax=Protea cynaroides TaxID=273540 RepID=A0A9Q0H7C3_9MAGN|nr:hypothetical protein NE237_020494 [Protea cynaroides]